MAAMLNASSNGTAGQRATPCASRSVHHAGAHALAEAAAVQQAADPADPDAERRDQREQIARGGAVAERVLREFHPGVAAEQRAEHGFARREPEPAVGQRPVEPALGEHIDELRPDERAEQRRDVNHHQPGIASREPRPCEKARGDGDEKQPAVRGGFQGAIRPIPDAAHAQPA